MMFYGPLGKCPICQGFFEFRVNRYMCGGNYLAWSKCPTSSRNPPRKNDMIKIPEGIADDQVREVNFKIMCSLFGTLDLEMHWH